MLGKTQLSLGCKITIGMVKMVTERVKKMDKKTLAVVKNKK